MCKLSHPDWETQQEQKDEYGREEENRRTERGLVKKKHTYTQNIIRWYPLLLYVQSNIDIRSNTLLFVSGCVHLGSSSIYLPCLSSHLSSTRYLVTYRQGKFSWLKINLLFAGKDVKLEKEGGETGRQLCDDKGERRERTQHKLLDIFYICFLSIYRSELLKICLSCPILVLKRYGYSKILYYSN